MIQEYQLRILPEIAANEQKLKDGLKYSTDHTAAPTLQVAI